MKKRTLTQPQKIVMGGAIVAVGLAGFLLYQNRINIADWISGMSYSPTPEMTAVENELSLTEDGKRILYATHPTLEQRDDFNYLCDSHNQDITILGCYTDNRIYLYDINEQSLAGVKESTLAHELLHAVWERMPESEKNRISKILTEVYENEQYKSLLAEDLELYDESKRMDELHSRIGTEIVELPEELEAHYAKYFKNQDSLVAHYNNYITPFREISAKLKEISGKIKELEATIDEQSKSYYELAEKLSSDIKEFNQCAEKSGCFESISAFQKARNELVTRKAEIEEMFTKVNDLIKQYNTLRDEYNENYLRGKTLESIINSNAKVEDIK